MEQEVLANKLYNKPFADLCRKRQKTILKLLELEKFKNRRKEINSDKDRFIFAADDDVTALSVIHSGYWNEPRYQILKEFCSSGGKILSVGCGPREPLIINATHSMDITPLSEKFLRENGYKGDFRVGSCTNLPYENRSFDIVVCSEVIEHLSTIDEVIKTFNEVSRVGKKWIIDTPNSDVIKPNNQNKHHIHFFTLESIKKIIPFPAKIYTNDHHIYIEGGSVA